jgi:hypothetical protein
MPSPLKRATVVGLSIATMLGLATIVSAAPYGVKDLKDLKEDKHSSPTVTNTPAPWFSVPSSSGTNFAVIAIGKNVTASEKQNAQDEVARNERLASLKIQSTNSVPVSGSTMFFFGGGLVGLAAWHGWSRRSMA